MPPVLCMLAGTAEAQAEPVSELSELAAEVREQQNFCSGFWLGR